MNQVCKNQLQKIIKQTDAKIVVSSFWRLGKIPLLQKFLNVYNLTIYSQTDLLDTRENEIHSWLMQNDNLNIAQWVAIDDMDMTFDGVHFVQTSRGMTSKDANEVIEKLNCTKIIKKKNLEDLGLDEDEYMYM